MVYFPTCMVYFPTFMVYFPTFRVYFPILVDFYGTCKYTNPMDPMGHGTCQVTPSD